MSPEALPIDTDGQKHRLEQLQDSENCLKYLHRSGIVPRSVVGFDVGNDTSCVALARKRGIDVLMNKESKRETPAVVNFGEWGDG